jgi:hypothetical protein
MLGHDISEVLTASIFSTSETSVNVYEITRSNIPKIFIFMLFGM